MTTDEILAAVEPTVRYHAELLGRRLSPDSGLTADDLAQEARAAVLKGAGGYDPSASKPRTYFHSRIRGAMLDAIRESSFAPLLAVQRGEPLVKVVAFNAVDRRATGDDDRYCVKRNSGRTLRFDPPHHDPEPADDTETEFLAFCRRLFDGLSAREKAVMRWYYCRDWTMKEIGARLGLSESRVSQIHTAVLGRLSQQQVVPA